MRNRRDSLLREVLEPAVERVAQLLDRLGVVDRERPDARSASRTFYGMIVRRPRGEAKDRLRGY